MQRNDRPHWAAIAASQLGPRQPELPAFVTVPEYVSPVGVPRPGQHAGFLGARFDPYLIASDPNSRSYNPGPIAAGFRVPPERLSQVETLLGAVERTTRVPGDSPSVAAFEQVRAEAFDLATSRAAREAFDLSRESEATRDRYGRHTFGQSTLVARRLVEAGVRIVQVNFERHDNGKGGQGYDSHSVPPNPAHLGWTQRELLPPTDAAFAALVEDLADRGLLDETLVVLMGEFGRTPRFNEWGGRDHWPNCYSLVLAGGGIQPGGVYGASDRIGWPPSTICWASNGSRRCAIWSSGPCRCARAVRCQACSRDRRDFFNPCLNRSYPALGKTLRHEIHRDARHPLVTPRPAARVAMPAA
jgi:hypothetical protein